MQTHFISFSVQFGSVRFSWNFSSGNIKYFCTFSSHFHFSLHAVMLFKLSLSFNCYTMVSCFCQFFLKTMLSLQSHWLLFLIVLSEVLNILIENKWVLRSQVSKLRLMVNDYLHIAFESESQPRAYGSQHCRYVILFCFVITEVGRDGGGKLSVPTGNR